MYPVPVPLFCGREQVSQADRVSWNGDCTRLTGIGAREPSILWSSSWTPIKQVVIVWHPTLQVTGMCLYGA